MLSVKLPSENHAYLVTVLRFCSRQIGCDVLDANFKFNTTTGVVLIAIIWYYLCSVYQIAKDFATDWTILLDVSSPVSCTTQGLVKLISVLLYPKLYFQLAEDIKEIYEKYEKINAKYKDILLRWNKAMRKIEIFLAMVYILTAVLMLSTPLVLYILKGERHLILLLQMPLIDVSTTRGYISATVFNVMCIFIGSFGLFAADSFLFLYLSHSLFFYDIFAQKVRDLHEVLEQDQLDERKTAILNDIVQWHQFYLQFNDNCNVIFFWTISAHVICSTAGILSTLLIIMLKDWPGAYVYILVCFIWLYMYCVMGTCVDICNDRFCAGIYDIKWFDLDLRNQKTVSLMLMQSQVPRIITIAGVEPLSMNTALKITRTIYSLVMMVLQFND